MRKSREWSAKFPFRPKRGKIFVRDARTRYTVTRYLHEALALALVLALLPAPE